jgi:hypothetical protein
VYYVPEYVADELKTARLLIPGVVTNVDEALVIPENLRKPLQGLSEEFAGDAESPLDQARRIKVNLEKQYRYTRTLVPVAGADPVWHFLFRGKEGNCEMFASAMALLLRSQGLPSRYVTGFLMRERNYLGDYYIVRERDAHAWTEMYIPELGWLPFDATPSVMEEGPGFQGILVIFAETIDVLRMKFQEFRIKSQTLEWSELFLWAAGQLKKMYLVLKTGFMRTVPLLLAGALALLFLIRYRKKKQACKPQHVNEKDTGSWTKYSLNKPLTPELQHMRTLLGEFEQCLAEKGMVRQPSQTLLEFLVDLETKSLTPQYLEYGKSLVKSYQQSRYGTSRVPDKRIAALSRQWNRLASSEDV